MQSHDSIQLAKLFIALKETQDRINNEILPLAACLWAVDDEGLFQTLELAQSAIGQYLKSWRLVAQETESKLEMEFA